MIEAVSFFFINKSGLPLYLETLKTWNNLEFDNLGKKDLE